MVFGELGQDQRALARHPYPWPPEFAVDLFDRAAFPDLNLAAVKPLAFERRK